MFKRSRMRPQLVYLTVNEDITSPLLRRQVLELLCKIHQKGEWRDITLVCFMSPLSILRKFSGLREVRKQLSAAGVKLKLLPLPVPWPFPHFTFRKIDIGWRPLAYWSRWAVRILPFFIWPIILYYRLVYGVCIFHCRSYPPAYAAIKFKQLNILSINVIFDPRSDFPEENVTTGMWSEGDQNFKFWKNTEALLLSESDRVACIAECYAKKYRKFAPSANLFYAPNNVDCKSFSRDSGVRKAVRAALGFSDDMLVLCYLGAMTSSGWHRPPPYRDLVELLANAQIAFRFVFLLPSYSNQLISSHFKGYIEQGRVVVINPKYDEVTRYLSACDYGVMFLHDEKNVVGTKVGEYLAAGLPVVANSNSVGATELISEHDLGFVIDSQSDFHRPSVIDGLLLQADLDSWSKRVSEFALGYFDNVVVATKYLAQYKELLSRN